VERFVAAVARGTESNYAIRGPAVRSKVLGGEALMMARTSYLEYDSKYFTHVTNGQLVDGVNQFSSDYRNRGIRIYAAVWLVVQGIAGTSQAEMEKITESWRQNSAD
jgi:hypothetical protein